MFLQQNLFCYGYKLLSGEQIVFSVANFYSLRFREFYQIYPSIYTWVIPDGLRGFCPQVVAARHRVEDWLGRVECSMRATVRRLVIKHVDGAHVDGAHALPPILKMNEALPIQVLEQIRMERELQIYRTSLLRCRIDRSIIILSMRADK